MSKNLFKRSREDIPIWFMRQAGRSIPDYLEIQKNYSFLEICSNPEIAAEVTLQPMKEYDNKIDAAIIFSDILIIPHGMKRDLQFIKERGPVMRPLEFIDEIKEINISDLESFIQPTLDAIKIVRENLPQGKDLIGFAGGPWTVASYVIPGSSPGLCRDSREWIHSKRDDMDYLIEFLTEATTDYLIKQVDNGADLLQIFDTNSGVLPVDDFYKYVIEPTKKIVKEVKNKHPNVPIIGFPKWAGMLYVDYVKETGVDGVSVDYSVHLEWARDNLQDLALVQGNLDPYLVAYDLEKAKESAKNIIEIWKDKGFIFNLGHGVLPKTPASNVKEIVEFVKRYS